MSKPRRLVALAAIMAVSAAMAGCAKEENKVAPTGHTTQCTYRVGGEPARPVDPPSPDAVDEGTAVVTMEMAAGKVTMTLDRKNAPCAVHSMESLVTQGFYDDTKCHRLVDQGIFILQCGDPTASGRGGPGYTYPDELTGKETYKRGTVAMANPGKDANGSQFFIVWADTSLDPDYTVLGTVDEESLVTIGKIASQGVDGTDPSASKPLADASIKKVVLG